MRRFVVALLPAFLAGCFSERSFPMRPGDLSRVSRPGDSVERLRVRPWLSRTHAALKSLLPPDHPSALLTDDLVQSDGRPVEVFPHFHISRPDRLDQIPENLIGLCQSAQATGPNTTVHPPRIAWTGYEEIWVPISERLSLAGMMGVAREGGQVIDADCIVVLPGLLGHNDTRRTKDLADALVKSGHHVLAIELRGHGHTNERYPEVYYTFGTLEIGDLMIVSEWLQAQPHIRRTGLVGYCWGANEALLAAWYDGRASTHPSISARMAPFVRPVNDRRHYEAGVIAFSPLLRYEEVVEAIQAPQSMWVHPVLASLQKSVRDRMVLKGHANPSGSLRKLIEEEFARSEANYTDVVEDALDFVRLWPHRGRASGDKFDDFRVPVLIVQAANDPLAPAQYAADLFAKNRNPNLAGIILSNGGHVGFAAYDRAYYYSLIVNFFDGAKGPVAAAGPTSSGAPVPHIDGEIHSH